MSDFLDKFWLNTRLVLCPHRYQYIALFHAGCGMGSESFETHKCTICGIYKEGVRGNKDHRNLAFVEHYSSDPTPTTHGQPIWKSEKENPQRIGFPKGLVVFSLIVGALLHLVGF